MIESYDLANFLYRLCYVLGFLTVFVFNTFYGKKYKIKPLRSFLFTLVSYLIIFGWSYILAWIMNGFEWGHHNAIRVYIWFPIVMLLTSRLFNLDYRACCEYVTPSTCIVYGIARLGCIFAGCCRGFAWEHGMYCAFEDYYYFPVQLCEAVTSLAIAVLMICLAKKKNYDSRDNTLYPLMLILYGGSRFLWEFAADNTKVIRNISELALWALATCLIGIIWLVIHSIRSKKEQL